MKIALFTDTFCDANGVSRFLQDMEREARKRGFALQVFTSTRKIHCNESPNIFNLPPKWRFPMPYYPELELVLPDRRRLRDACFAFDPDIIHVSTPGPVGLLGRSIALKHKLPLVGTYHTDFPQCLLDNTGSRQIEKIAEWSMKRFYSTFDHILTRSTLYQKILYDHLDFRKEEVTVLSAGTDTSRFHPRFRQLCLWQDLGIPLAGFKLLYVGRLSKEKRFDALLQLWERFKMQTGSDAQFIIAGEGKQASKAIAMKNLDVHYLGHREKDELSFLYAASDLFISASVTETLGQTILEAIASGTPVIVSGTGGHLDFIDEACGAIVQSDNTEIWMDALMNLYTNTTQREIASHHALKKGQSMSISRSFEHFIQIHQSVKDKH